MTNQIRSIFRVHTFHLVSPSSIATSFTFTRKFHVSNYSFHSRPPIDDKNDKILIAFTRIFNIRYEQFDQEQYTIYIITKRVNLKYNFILDSLYLEDLVTVLRAPLYWDNPNVEHLWGRFPISQLPPSIIKGIYKNTSIIYYDLYKKLLSDIIDYNFYPKK
jgi:hypothetical protein